MLYDVNYLLTIIKIHWSLSVIYDQCKCLTFIQNNNNIFITLIITSKQNQGQNID